MKKKLFGTDGIRGKANQYPISADMMLKVGQAIGLYFREHVEHPRILIGKDTRVSGYMLEQALSAGICSMGVDTCMLGPLPTPGIAYLTRGLRASGGIVISASHNPYEDNGVKLFAADGFKLPDSAELELERMVLEGVVSSASRGRIGTTTRIDDALGQYAVFLKEQFPKHLSLEGVKLVLDCAHGAGYRVAPKVFSELGATVHVINASPNGTNINRGCGALHPKQLATYVKQTGSDLGLAFDGDADRLVVVDDTGEVLDGDEILAICGTDAMSKGQLAGGTLVATVMSNMGLELCMQRQGGRVLRTAVGDRYVVEEMRRGGYTLGGEQSGHLIFLDSSTTGDGVLAALKLLQVASEQNKPLSMLKKCMERLPQVLQNIAVPHKVPIDEMPELCKEIAAVEAKLGKSGRVLFRYSGTELKARIMLEGEDLTQLQSMLDDLSASAFQHITNYNA